MNYTPQDILAAREALKNPRLKKVADSDAAIH